ncbi:sterol desaturase family protein [Gramella sp. AN32]|uniref:Sterol desaturase family protein n=1 Tax=Christiangramia antarctica TaxID=2058158 RepID=A0ABW5X6I2_9FLAO|nr:sterol desaturase family protein [Gramella sp. AN32]MCM4155947.1 sterol desaturase family protein [Gramella sp. AN32]
METSIGLISEFLLYIFIFFLILVVRYFIAAGFFYYYYYIKNKEKFQPKKLSTRPYKKAQFKSEIKWSLISSVIFAITGAFLFFLYQKGFTQIYLDLNPKDIWYFPLSLIVAPLIHETYYYWLHRWMHKPWIYRKVHKVHHDSLTPSPWTAFSFHPWEAILEAIILPLLLILLPLHISVVVLYLLIMTVSSVINHLDIEIYSEKFQKSLFGKMLIGATHHHFHHAEFKTNYGLYFTFWDKWMNTESEKMNN